MTERITVRKLDAEGEEIFRYSGQILRRTENELLLEAIFDMEPREFHGLAIRTGDHFVESHYGDRWYNVFAIHDAVTGQLKGWYCNVTRPAIVEDTTVSAEDLALDLVVYPDGTWLVLDEDEFEALDLDDGDRSQALAALTELQRYAKGLTGPFAAQMLEGE